jgi:DNA-binding XRE family transcriptional regulator
MTPRTSTDRPLKELTAERARLDAEIEQAISTHADQTNALFGRNLKRLRELRGLTQEELAGLIGLSRTSVTNQEAGRQATSWATLILLADVLDVSLEAFRSDEVEARDGA